MHLPCRIGDYIETKAGNALNLTLVTCASHGSPRCRVSWPPDPATYSARADSLRPESWPCARLERWYAEHAGPLLRFLIHRTGIAFSPRTSSPRHSSACTGPARGSTRGDRARRPRIYSITLNGFATTSVTRRSDRGRALDRHRTRERGPPIRSTRSAIGTFAGERSPRWRRESVKRSPCATTLI